MPIPDPHGRAFGVYSLGGRLPEDFEAGDSIHARSRMGGLQPSPTQPS